jgi:hypothetical protein
MKFNACVPDHPPDPSETRRAASAKGSPNRKPDFNSNENNNTIGTEQGETALAAAMRTAMARKAVRI